MSNVAEKVTCDLCGLEAIKPLKDIFIGIEKNFCCLGCQNVFAMLTESGLLTSNSDLKNSDLFQQSLALGLISNPNITTPEQVKFKLPENAPTKEVIFQISGMWCSACAWFIETVLQKQVGIIKAEVFFASDLAKIKYYPQLLPLENLKNNLKDLGYPITLFTEESAQDQEKNGLLLRLGIAAFLWLNIMTLNTTLYVGYFEQISESFRHFLPYLLMLLTAPIIFYCAQPILIAAINGFKHRTIRMETLLGVGIIAAYVYSILQVVKGGTHVYFDTASAIVTLVLLGKYIERSAKIRVSQAIVLLYQMMPKKARIWIAGKENFVSIENLKAGDEFIVKVGERIPADGIVITGKSHADESLLTGESLPVAKEPGSEVVCGSINKDSLLQIKATKVGSNTTLNQIINLVENSLSSRSVLIKTVDRISQTFVPIVIALSFTTFLYVGFLGNKTLGEALMQAITVLVIACPCALGMATPLAITAAIGAATSQGILVRDSSVLEKFYKLNTVVLDKTGTITKGVFSLVNFQLVNNLNKDFILDYLPLLSSLESASEHPLGRAIVNFANKNSIKILSPREVKIYKGKGIIGTVEDKEVFVGNRSLLQDLTINSDVLHNQAQSWENRGYTVVFFGVANQLVGIMVFGDEIRPEAASLVERLKQQGMRVLVVSGDALATTKAVAEQIQADSFYAETLPEKKAALLKEFQAQGAVLAMVGDGINDAPALAQADLGIALGSGTDIAIQAAAIVLMKNSLTDILSTFDLANKTRRVIKQNLFWAFLYNSLGISLAIIGLLNPLIAAGAMLISSVSVIVNSLRLISLIEAKRGLKENSLLKNSYQQLQEAS